MLSVLTAAALGAFALGGCSKQGADKGTLNVKAWSPEGNVIVSVYPYVEGYNKLSPVTSSILTSSNKTVSFELNAGNYIVAGSRAGAIGVQIQAGEEVNLEIKNSGFIRPCKTLTVFSRRRYLCCMTEKAGEERGLLSLLSVKRYFQGRRLFRK